MKLLSTFLALAVLATTGAAQSVQYLLLQYSQQNTQTDATTVSPTATPYSFSAQVIGDSMTGSNPLTGATVTLPDGTTVKTLTFPQDNWQYESGDYASDTALTSAYPTSSYSFGLVGTPNGSFPVTMGNPFSPAVYLNAPLLTLTNGAWSGGKFMVTDVSQDVVISFNSLFGGSPASDQAYLVDASLDGPGYSSSALGDGPNFFHYNPMPPSPHSVSSTIGDWTIPGGSLTSGESYTVNVNYTYMLALTPGSPMNASLYARSTTLTISSASPVPEPATYALWAGLIALVGVVALRRRKKSAA